MSAPVSDVPVSDVATRSVRPADWSEALRAKADDPELVPIAGGTDLMVELNFARRRPAGLLDLSRLSEPASWELVDGPEGERGEVRLGATVSYTRVIDELADVLPALAMAARTVGSPQIRNRGTVGGNLGTASPAGDSHPPLLALGAVVEVESVRGARDIAIDDFFTGPKRHALAPDELIRAVRLPVRDAPQQFSKIGPRNAMVIATASFAVCLHRERRSVGTGIGSAGPTPLRAFEAEAYASGALATVWDDPRPADPDVCREFGQLVAAAAQPIDDVRGTERYRRHALGVLAQRALTWVWDELAEEALGWT